MICEACFFFFFLRMCAMWQENEEVLPDNDGSQRNTFKHKSSSKDSSKVTLAGTRK